MAQEVQSALLLHIRQRLPSLSHLTIDWFGGEPLLEMPIIRKVNGSVLEQLGLGNATTWFRSGITTNGYLLNPAIFKELLDLKIVQFQITLDGPKDIHNKTRKMANGKGSFDQILENINYMHNQPGEFDVLLRLHLMTSNINELPELIDLLENMLEGDNRFKIFLKPIKNLGGEGASFCKTEMLLNDNELTEKLKNTLVTSLDFWTTTPVCYASKLNSYIVRADGRISKCTTALEDPVNTIGKLLQNGHLEIQREKVLKWSRGIFNMDKDCLYCPHKGINKEYTNMDYG